MSRKMTDAQRKKMKEQRLELIKERYRKLILDPRSEIEMELFGDSPEPEYLLDVAD